MIEQLTIEQLRERMSKLLAKYERERELYANKFGRMAECWYQGHKQNMDIAISTGKRLNAEYRKRTGNDYDFHFID